MAAEDGTKIGAASYDGLAAFYARYWGPRYHEAADPVLARLLYQYLPAGSRVLDLCCGTGHLSARLLQRGFVVCGLDASLDMLRIARQTAPGVPLVCADAAGFRAAPVFDAVACTFDSLNHVLDPAALASVFAGVAAALVPGGRFVFDVNTERAYRTEWQKSTAIVEDAAAMFLRGGYDGGRRVACTDISMFWRDESSSDAGAPTAASSDSDAASARWRRRDLRILQRPWDASELRSLLAAGDLREISVYDAAAAGMHGDIAVGRIFVIARR